MTKEAREPRTRGYRKKERTRRHLIAAGLRVLGEKGHGLTVSDVVAEAEVSNGTFYNYFADRDALIDALAEHSLVSLAAQSAVDTPSEDPALRFSFATARVLMRAVHDPTWGRAVLRLGNHRRSPPYEMQRYLREDLSTGYAQGRFTFGADEITLDAVTGLILMSLRRIVRGELGAEHVERVLSRALTTLGVEPAESAMIAVEALREAVAESATRVHADA